MDIDSPPNSTAASPLKPRDRILQRLALLGVPEENLDQSQHGLVAFVNEDRDRLPEVVSAILPTDDELAETLRESKPGGGSSSSSPSRALSGPTAAMTKRFRESMSWLQWLMFMGDPIDALKEISKLGIGQRGVCGAVWGHNDIAYRCKTCQHDPTCAICVPCFQNGNHKDHDYSVIYTGGGCCDCGDVTAWKREGFCSRHKGAEQIQPLPEKFAGSVGPALDAVFLCWKRKLLLAEQASDRAAERKKGATELTFAVVEMLLEFCKQSESLLSFISKRVFSSVGLLEILVRAERFVGEVAVKKLHELLLKLLGEPVFKYEFAKEFLKYYPTFVSEAVRDCKDTALKRYPLLPTFSVQIFTVPTLTPRLVKEMNLLTMLLECLGNIFESCASADGRLQVSKWSKLHEITFRVIEDVRFAMSHSGVPDYVTKDQQDITRTWIRLLSYVQGMDSQKRETGLHIEEESDHLHLPFVLGHSIANIQLLLVDGAFSLSNSEDVVDDDDHGDELVSKSSKQDTDDGYSLRHSKVGRLSEESYPCSAVGRIVEPKFDSVTHRVIPQSVTWLTHECLRAIENWLAVDNTSRSLGGLSSPSTSSLSTSNFLAIRKTLSKIRKGRTIFGRLASSSEDHGGQSASLTQFGSRLSFNSQNDRSSASERKAMVIGESGSVDDSSFEGDGSTELDNQRVLSLSEWPEIVYDVSSQEVSVHILLHRFLSLLLQKSLRRCFGESEVQSVAIANSAFRSSPIYTDFFGQTLTGCHPLGFSAFIMEHPLRNRVFCAEVLAGMWRKNGDAGLLSCEWYRSVRWSEQGLELDLFLLQCCGAMAPADSFVYRILERFGLSNYLSLDLECPNEYEGVLVQEMLNLIIQIVKERRFCGQTKAESVKRELIYKLATGDSTRSQLVKSLPRDLSKYEKLQEILDGIALYSNPSGFNQGTYSLRWECWNELDLYHPRWTSRDLQLAEERYLRFRGASALSNQLPEWSKIYPPLSGLARVATCKPILQIVRAVLFYAVYTDHTTESRAPDSVLLTSLHLLWLALDTCSQCRQSNDIPFCDRDSVAVLAFAGEEMTEGFNYNVEEQCLLSLLVSLMRIHKNEAPENSLDAGSCNLSALIDTLLKRFAELDSGCMKILHRIAPEVVSHLVRASLKDDANASKSASESEKRKAKARERQAAILEKMRAEQAKFLASIDSPSDEGPKPEEASSGPDVCSEREESAQIACSLCHDPSSKSPVSFLVLLQKSRLLSFADRTPPSWENPCQSGKEKDLKTVNKMTDQPGIGTSFRGLVAEGADHSQRVQVPCVSNHEETNLHSSETLEEDIYMSIIREMQEQNLSEEDPKLSAIEKSSSRRKYVETTLLGKYIAACYREIADNPSASDISRAEKVAKEIMQQPTYDGFGPRDCDGIFLSSCGHAVHQICLDRYLRSLRERYNRRIVFEGGHIVDPDQGEFLCPVCRRLANSTLPTWSGEFQKVLRQPNDSSASSSHASGFLYKSSEETNSLRLRKGLALLQSAANAVCRAEILKDVSLQKSEKIIPNLVSRVLSKMYFSSKHDKLLRSPRVNYSMLMWDVLKYSLESMEIAARCGRTHMSPTYGLDALYKELESSTGFTLSLILKTVQSTPSKNSLHTLQRFRGIQSFTDSICCSVSMDDISFTHGPGAMLNILCNIDTEVSYPDIQFWNRASDPIIACDPFSSLMWVLFSLPYPFLSCEDSLLHLIHVFYVVTVVQVIIAYCGKYPINVNESGVGDSLITDLLKLVGESDSAREYFVSNYIGQSDSIENVIRSMSFPYLRRCALLWKLLISSVKAPFNDTDCVDRSHSITYSMDGSDGGLTEIDEIEKLETMFKIPPIGSVLKDELICSLSLRWFRHFNHVFEPRRFQRNIHCNPAVPFKLMQLPRVYQDLLQRCIKQPCPECNAILDDPALCLLCGKLCCPNWKHCCRENGCQVHAMSCGAGTGIFLLIRKTTILLQRSARQAPWPSPYLDAFGEEDIEMHRGKPLYLNEERYTALTYMVASHGLDRNSRVLGQTTIGSFVIV